MSKCPIVEQPCIIQHNFITNHPSRTPYGKVAVSPAVFHSNKISYSSKESLTRACAVCQGRIQDFSVGLSSKAMTVLLEQFKPQLNILSQYFDLHKIFQQYSNQSTIELYL